MIIDVECPLCLGTGEVHDVDDDINDAAEVECPRCGGTSAIMRDLNEEDEW